MLKCFLFIRLCIIYIFIKNKNFKNWCCLKDIYVIKCIFVIECILFLNNCVWILGYIVLFVYWVFVLSNDRDIDRLKLFNWLNY